MSKLIELSEQLAEKFYENQFDLVYRPQLSHIKRVVKLVELDDGTNYEISAAWLHDVLEIPNNDVAGLRKLGVPKPVVDIIVALTKEEGESARAFMRRLSENDSAVKIQRAIIKENTNMDRFNRMDPNSIKRILNKYNGYSKFLDEALSRKV